MKKQKVWAVVGQKGGEGKSTIAYALSDYLAKHGRKTALLDMDRPQFSSVLLGKLGDKPLSFDLIRCANMRDVHKHSTGFEAIVFDGAPHASSETLQLCGYSDCIVIPTRTSTINLKPALDLASELVANGIDQNKIVFLISQALTHSEARDARATIVERGYRVLTEDLRMYPAYAKIGDAGRSLLEVQYPTLRERAERVFAELAKA
jgi:chromosome partitioning protein